MSSRPAWSTKASFRTDSKATEKPCLKKQTNKTKDRVEQRMSGVEAEVLSYIMKGPLRVFSVGMGPLEALSGL